MRDEKITVGSIYILPPLVGRLDESKTSDPISAYTMVEGAVEVCQIVRSFDASGQSLGYVKVKKTVAGLVEVFVIDAIEFICAINGFPMDKMPPEIVRDLGQVYL